MYRNQSNNMFMDMVNIISLILQMQNAESFKVDQMRESIENKIDQDINKKLDIIIKRLDDLENNR